MRWLISSIVAILMLPATASAQTTSPAAAAEFIQALGAEAIEILGNQQISLSEREVQLQDMVEDNVTVPIIGRFVLDDTWGEISESKQRSFLGLFSDYMMQTYVQRLGGYTGQRLRIDGFKVHRERDALVETTIEQDGAEPMHVSWLVRDMDDGMQIVDVVIEGKSLARTQRSEFKAIIAREKFEGLMQLLQLKVSKFSAQS